MKICLVGPTHPFRGGISHYTTLMFRALKKRHQVVLFSFRRQYPQWLFPGESDKDPSENPICETGIHYTIDSLNPYSWVLTARSIIRISPDLMIIPWWTSFWTLPFLTIAKLVKWLANTKILFLCHNIQEHESNFASRLCTRWVLSHGDGFIVHSREEGEKLKSILPNARITQAFHPTYQDLQVVTYTKADAREKLKVDGNVVLFFGFIRPYKGLDYLLDAVPPIIQALNGDLTVMIVGESWRDEEHYQDKIDSLQIRDHILRVNQYIPNEEVSLYLAASDLVAIPYVSTTGSGILQAALGANRPVVATRIGALAEAVDHGRTGYLVPPADSKGLSAAVIEFFSKKMGASFEKEIDRQKSRFSWNRMVEIIETCTLETS